MENSKFNELFSTFIRVITSKLPHSHDKKIIYLSLRKMKISTQDEIEHFMFIKNKIYGNFS